MRLRLLLPLLLALPGCASVTRPALAAALQGAERRTPVTILVSIDGFRPDYLGGGDTPALDALAKQGVSAAMRPSFPSNTFPNHYTLVTGLRPDRHGVVDNTMEDPARPGVRFATADVKQAQDPFWWDGAEPIWVAAERAGVRTGTVFWPGSQAPIRGVRPSAWLPYDAAITGRQRVAFALDWLRRPLAEWPRLLTLYFDVVDKTSHNRGFDSPEKFAAIREVDADISALREGLARMGQPANLVIVSDHGMAPVPLDHWLDAGDIASEADARTIVAGPLLSVFPSPGREAAVAASALRPRPHVQCWPKERIPARFGFGRNSRVPPIVCLAEIGWAFPFGGRPPAYIKGEHGYDPSEPAMRALFLGVGPAFRKGRRLPDFDNVDVYPLLRELMGLPPAPGIDGTAAPFDAALTR